MKKYLMIGVAALAFAVTLTSCSKAGDLYDELSTSGTDKSKRRKISRRK